MRIESVPIGSLTNDPRNARLHDDANMAAIVASLGRFGQQKPIVVDADGVVLAGNGTLEAARRLGWTVITVSRSSLRGAEARAYAFADNRSGELAEWDLDEVNRTLSELDAGGFDVALLGISDAELAALADGDYETAHAFAPKKPKDETSSAGQTITPQYKVIVTCKTEAEQAEIVTWLKRRGADYKAPSV